MKNLLSLVALALLLGGCSSQSTYTPSPAAKVEPIGSGSATPTSLFPMAVGNQWTYELDSTNIDGAAQQRQPLIEVTYKISKVEKTPEGTKCTVDIFVGDTAKDRIIYVANDKGIYEAATTLQDLPFTPMQPVIDTPFDSGRVTNWSGVGAIPGPKKTGKITMTNKILPNQVVDTEVGPMNAVPVESKISMEGGVKAATTMYLTPGVGMSRQQQNIGLGQRATLQVFRLKSYSLKKP